MTDNARSKPAENPERPPQGSQPFSLEAYLARQHAEFADGPTMAEILEDLDRYRSQGLPGDLIVASIREDRERHE